MKKSLTVTIEESVIDRIDSIAYSLNITRGSVVHAIFDMAFDESVDVCEGMTFNNLTQMIVRVKVWYEKELERRKEFNLNNNKKLRRQQVSRNS